MVWSQLQNLNYRTPDERVVLRKRQQKAKKMIHYTKEALEQILQEIEDVELYWEWPRDCAGWSELAALERAIIGSRTSWTAAASTSGALWTTSSSRNLGRS